MHRHPLAMTIIAALFLASIGCESDQRTDHRDDPARPAAIRDTPPEHHITVTPDNTPWTQAPASLPPGARMAILEGDPAKPGFFCIRLEMPDGYRIPPHWHPNVERVTVIAGTFHLGSGTVFEPTNTVSLPAGTYSSMPPRMRHFAWAEGRTVIQINTLGPWAINYVNPEDDPRQSAR